MTQVERTPKRFIDPGNIQTLRKYLNAICSRLHYTETADTPAGQAVITAEVLIVAQLEYNV